MNNKKIILLIGKTGGGKSTLANVILGKRDEKGDFKEVFGESAGSVSKTKKVQIEEFKEGDIEYQIVDTVGVGDTGMSLDSVLRKLALMGYSVKNGLHQILFVTDGQLSKESKLTYDLLAKVVFDERVAEYTTIVRTRADWFTCKEDCEKDKEIIIRNNEIFGKFIKASNSVVYVDNPATDVDEGIKAEKNRKRKKESRKRLLDHLGLICQEKPYEPENLRKLSKEIGKYEEEKKGLKKEKTLHKIKNNRINSKITEKMVKHIGGIDKSLKKGIEEELKRLESKEGKVADWKWFVPKTNNGSVQGSDKFSTRFDEIENKLQEYQKRYSGFFEEEKNEKISKLVYVTDVEEKKEGEKISDDLKNSVSILLRMQEIIIRDEDNKENKSDYQQFLKESLDELGEKMDAKNLKEVCSLQESLVKKNIESDKILSKVGYMRLIDSEWEGIYIEKEELEDKFQEYQEEYFQMKIKRVEERFGSESNESIKVKLSSEISLLKTEEKELKIKKIIRKVTNFLRAKRTFLEKRRKNIRELASHYNELDGFINENYAKQVVMAKLISDMGDAVELDFKVNPIKMAGAAANAVNEYEKINVSKEISNKFSSRLKDDMNSILLFKKVYESLFNVCEKENKQEISSKVAGILQIKLEEAGVETIKEFKVRYSEILSIFDGWKKEYLNLDDMKKKLDSLEENLNTFEKELDKEENLFKRIENDYNERKLNYQIQIDSNVR